MAVGGICKAAELVTSSGPPSEGRARKLCHAQLTEADNVGSCGEILLHAPSRTTPAHEGAVFFLEMGT